MEEHNEELRQMVEPLRSNKLALKNLEAHSTAMLRYRRSNVNKWYFLPDYWRGRASEARAIAEQLDDVEAKTAMLAVADDYEKIACRYESQAARARAQSASDQGLGSGSTAAQVDSRE